MPTHAEFRAAGKTINARNHPYSPRAQAIVARHNGVTVEQLPNETFLYAANSHMRVWMDMLGAAAEAGKMHRFPDGRWFTMRQLMGII